MIINLGLTYGKMLSLLMLFYVPQQASCMLPGLIYGATTDILMKENLKTKGWLANILRI